MLALCGQSFDPIWTDFGGGVTRTAEWRRSVNEMGEFPVLEDSGVRLTQTAPILLRLSRRHGRFGGENEDENFEILRWLFWDNHKLTGYIATYRFMRAFTQSTDAAVLAGTQELQDGFQFLAALSGGAAHLLRADDFATGIRLLKHSMKPI
jgi:glutathione S-transferase